MKPRSPKQQAIIVVASASLAVLVVMGGLLIVPQHAIVVLTTGAVVIGCGATLIVPGLISAERHQRRARGEGTGADDASAHRGLCTECGWHWRARPNDDGCPRCGAPLQMPQTR
jgi:hypothetical protein